MSSSNVTLHRIRTREEFRRREFPMGGDSCSDVYYKESSVGVPFLWESRPGTPKIKSAQYPLPPLTPPPSFHATKPSKNQSRQILPTLKRAQLRHSPTSRSWSTSSFHSRIEEDHECQSPVSTLCFGAARRGARPSSSPGCSSSIIRLLLREFS